MVKRDWLRCQSLNSTLSIRSVEIWWTDFGREFALALLESGRSRRIQFSTSNKYLSVSNGRNPGAHIRCERLFCGRHLANVKGKS